MTDAVGYVDWFYFMLLFVARRQRSDSSWLCPGAFEPWVVVDFCCAVDGNFLPMGRQYSIIVSRNGASFGTSN